MKRVRRSIRRTGDGVNVAADLNVVVATSGDAATSSQQASVAQAGPRPTRGEH